MDFPGRVSWLLLLLLVVVVVLIRRLAPSRLAWFARLETGIAFPLLAGILAASLTLWQWDGLRASPVVNDEASYLLQAELFASGRWTLPTPPVSESFTQPAVLLTPVLAPKMAPGHAILLLPGIWLGIPGLMPMVMVALTGFMIVVLMRRIAGASVAALALAIWLTQAAQARWRASYLTENATMAFWLVGWWALWRWRDTRQAKWLLLLAAVTGWGAITRPLTMLVFAIPVGIVVLVDAFRERRFAQLAAALALGTAFLMLVPLQNSKTLGRWNASPLTLYTRQYIPWDRMGMGLDSTPPLYPMPGPLARANEPFIELHRKHTVAALPGIVGERMYIWYATNFGAWRKFFAPVALLALLLMPAPLWFAFATSAGLYLAYIAYAHDPSWVVYYAETTPVIAGVIALGAGWLLKTALDSEHRAQFASVVIALLILVWASPDLRRWREGNVARQQQPKAFRAAATALSGEKLLVFLRYADTHDPHAPLLRNVVDREHDRLMTAHDLGEAQRRALRAAFPDRTAYVWDETTNRFLPEPR